MKSKSAAERSAGAVGEPLRTSLLKAVCLGCSKRDDDGRRGRLVPALSAVGASALALPYLFMLVSKSILFFPTHTHWITCVACWIGGMHTSFQGCQGTRVVHSAPSCLLLYLCSSCEHCRWVGDRWSDGSQKQVSMVSVIVHGRQGWSLCAETCGALRTRLS